MGYGRGFPSGLHGATIVANRDMHAVEPLYPDGPSYPDGLSPGELAASAAAAMEDVKGVSAAKGLFGLAGVVLSGVVVLAAAFAYRDLRLDVVAGMIPRTPLFWTVFVAFFMTGSLLDWVIFHRLWRIPFWSGLAALMRKQVSNELVLGYLGEAQFYAWARARGTMIAVRSLASGRGPASQSWTLAIRPGGSRATSAALSPARSR